MTSETAVADLPLPPEGETSLDELFSKDPEQLTDADYLAIIAAYRAKRELWLAAESQGKKPKAAKAPKASVAAPAQITLADLGIDL